MQAECAVPDGMEKMMGKGNRKCPLVDNDNEPTFEIGGVPVVVCELCSAQVHGDSVEE